MRGFAHVDTWVFDLDNTLHQATPHIFPHINRSMTEYIERHLGVDLVAEVEAPEAPIEEPVPAEEEEPEDVRIGPAPDEAGEPEPAPELEAEPMEP